MTYTLTQLTDDVMTRLGENARPLPPTSSAWEIPSARSRMENRIRTHLPEIGSALLLETDIARLEGAESLSPAVASRRLPCGLYAAEIPLPEDYLRLVAIKMVSWNHAAEETITPASGEWGRQWSKESGIAGCASRPKVYLMINSDGLRLIAVGSESSDDRLEHCLIWRVPKCDSEGRFSYPANLLPRLISRLADTLS